MMMVPEAWENHTAMPDWLRDFYAFHSCLMEPWDGPASVAFCDGTLLGATLDRNGLRPGRWQVTKDDFVVMASETGVLEYPAGPDRRARAASRPGRSSWSTSSKGRVVEDGEIKHEIAHQQPYGDWYRAALASTSTTSRTSRPRRCPADPIVTRQLMFGYSQEDLRVTLARHGRREGRGADRLDGQRLRARGPVRQGARRSTATSSSSSRRSRTRRSTRSASAS